MAPALAAKIACAAEKQRVTLTIVPASDKALHAISPSTVRVTFTATLSDIEANLWPSLIILLASVAAPSALTGPSINLQISAIISRNDCPVLATRDGFVVIPSTIPVLLRLVISLMLAVSKKNFIAVSLFCL